MAGYVKIGRSVFGHNMFKEEPYTEREGWIWLICGASYKTDTIRIPNTSIVTEVKRGDYVASIRFLATKFKWSNSRVRRFLDRLERGKMLSTVTDTGITKITIANYDKWQFFVEPPIQQQTKQRIKTDTNISKEVNKVSIYTSHFEDFWSTIPSKMRKGKGKAFRSFKKANFKLTIEELAEKYKKHHEINNEFTKHPSTWLNQECWLDDEVQETTKEPTLIERMVKLGYHHRGREGDYEQFSKDGKNWKLHRYKKNSIIELDK